MLFSGHVLGSNLLSYVTRNSDQVLIGRFLGQQSFGLYSLAYQLMLYPLQHVSSVIVRVLFPRFPRSREILSGSRQPTCVPLVSSRF